MKQDLEMLLKRLVELHNRLEAQKSNTSDLRLARELEDRIGCGGGLAGDVERAESLLARYAR